MTNNSQTSKYWLDQAVAEITVKIPKGKIILSSGISPSASYHIGHFREILTVDALTWGVKQAGRDAEHLHIVDNFDPLRKRYSFLPESFEEYVGQPVCLIPDPEGECHKTYADHFYSEFETYIHKLGIYPTIIKSYEDLYAPGKMTERFEDVLENLDEIRKIFREVSNRELEDDWTPIQVLGDDKKYFNASAKAWDKSKKTIEGKSYANGHAKLNWRLDWPARWTVLGVQVEPFGRELASAGSAYQTGVQFARKVFKIEPPLPVAQYEPIHLIGETKKMSSSLGNLITPKQALEIMPAEVLRYFVVRSKPERKIHFDPGLGLMNLIDEYAKVKAAVENKETTDFKEAYQFASQVAKDDANSSITTIPFNHLVSVYQAASGDSADAISALERTGYKVDQKAVTGEFKYVAHWLKNYAPDEVKFEVQKELPKVELTDNQNKFLQALASSLESVKDVDGQKMHELIYVAKETAGLEPKEAFQTLYKIILNQDSGPKAGWFLSSLEHDWLIKRLKLLA